MKKRIPLKSSAKELILSWTYTVLCIISWIIIFVCGVQLILYYVYITRTQGIFSSESIRIGIYLIIGAFFVMFINGNEVKKIFNIK